MLGDTLEQVQVGQVQYGRVTDLRWYKSKDRPSADNQIHSTVLRFGAPCAGTITIGRNTVDGPTPYS